VSTTDKIKNAGQDAEGKVKEAVGRAVGDRDTTAEGEADQAEAALKNAGEKAKDAASAAVDAAKTKLGGQPEDTGTDPTPEDRGQYS
jgi:uncharacterized protein YjbJ (UPF0337 family)